MGLQTLVQRLGTILPTYFDDIRSVLIGDFVGRDTNGAPVAGNNLGDNLFPWGTVWATTLNLGGSAVDPTLLENSAFKIVSGAKRASSNQPQFLVPAGSSPNFTVQGATTPLIFESAGVTGTISTNVATAGTLAPSSNNTCLVNDTTASGQAATRTWGEYGAPNNITVDSMGSAITALVGKWQAFKIGSEYFLAYVESTTLLSRCFRGFFFNSSGAPIPRSTFSDDATITLMSLGWVFADTNGTTVEATYNKPTVSAVTPSSPATADYWFDMVNQVWKRYNGSSFVVVSRHLIGLAVMDTSNCVAARSFDFFALVRADNTIDLDWASTTQVKGRGIFSKCNVNGQRISFGVSRPMWSTSTSVAASTERYNAAVTASTTEYLYLTDAGLEQFSDMEPYWRADLLGWYHPYNPWRALGNVGVDGSVNLISASLPRYETPPARKPTVSSSCGNTAIFSTSSFTAVNNLSVTITTSGRPVVLALVPDGSTHAAYISTDSNQAQYELLRGSTVISLTQIGAYYSGAGTDTVNLPPPGIICIDVVAAGTYTYTLKGYDLFASTTTMNYMQLVAYEL